MTKGGLTLIHQNNNNKICTFEFKKMKTKERKVVNSKRSKESDIKS